ncbi:MAG: hypothetical protein HOV97_05410 [Nonomuraea sp.]|nr:hypothetical protein [Nonomuraea sp.]
MSKLAAFLTMPTGHDGRDEVSINIEEIASFKGHTKVSYSYEDWTLVTLKNGVQHDCRIKKAEFERRLQALAAGPVRP